MFMTGRSNPLGGWLPITVTVRNIAQRFHVLDATMFASLLRFGNKKVQKNKSLIATCINKKHVECRLGYDMCAKNTAEVDLPKMDIPVCILQWDHQSSKFNFNPFTKWRANYLQQQRSSGAEHVNVLTLPRLYLSISDCASLSSEATI